MWRVIKVSFVLLMRWLWTPSKDGGWLPGEPTRQLEGWNFPSHSRTSRERRGAGGWIDCQWLGFPGGAVVKNPPPMQGTWVRALVWEDPTCHGATKPVRHNYWAWALEPMSHNYWARVPQLLSPHATTTEAHVPRAGAPQQEKPPQWEAHAPQWRVAPARRN